MGYGTLFGGLNQIIVPYVKDYLFLYCGILAVIGGLLLIVVILTEWKLDDEPDKLNKEIEMHWLLLCLIIYISQLLWLVTYVF